MNEIIPIDEEYFFDGKVIISQTDLKGVLTYVNKLFCKVSGYKVEELIGQSHNILRHPDMPHNIFAKMWETIQGGQAWNGLIKNLRKDGLYYWIDMEILPIKDNDNNITGYIAAEQAASRKDIQEIEERYKKLIETEKKRGRKC